MTQLAAVGQCLLARLAGTSSLEELRQSWTELSQLVKLATHSQRGHLSLASPERLATVNLTNCQSVARGGSDQIPSKQGSAAALNKPTNWQTKD